MSFEVNSENGEKKWLQKEREHYVMDISMDHLVNQMNATLEGIQSTFSGFKERENRNITQFQRILYSHSTSTKLARSLYSQHTGIVAFAFNIVKFNGTFNGLCKLAYAPRTVSPLAFHPC